MKGLIRILPIVALMAVSVPCICPQAADTEVVFGEEPEDAVKGHIIVRAVEESGFESDVTVELYPCGEDGVPHRYELTEENGYGVSDDIQVGEYEYVSFTQNENAYSSHVPRSVSVSGGETAYFIVVVGDRDFVWDYEWLSDFRKDGERMSGVITEEEAQALFDYSVSQQTGDTPEDYPADDTHPEEDASEGATSAAEEPETITPEGEGEENEEKPVTGPRFPVAALAAAILLALIYLLIKKRNRK